MIYLDNAATSHPKPDTVVEAVTEYLREIGASPGRSSHQAARRADEIVFRTRQALARLFGVEKSERIVFTANATEALNLAIRGTLKPGEHAVTTSLEHNSVLRPLRELERLGLELTIIESDGASVDIDEIRRAIKPETRLVVTSFASNVTGAVLPVRRIGEIARERGALYLVDAAQAAGSWPIDLGELPIDMLAFTGHKGLLGPMGTGGLYIREGIDIEPLKYGGTGSDSANPSQPEVLPDRFEAGTLNGPGLAGLGASVQYILEIGVDSIRNREAALAERLEAGLRKTNGVHIHKGGASSDRTSKKSDRISLISITIDGVESQRAAYELDRDFDICVRAGLHCAPDAHRSILTFPGGTVRFSPGQFTTVEEIDAAIEAVGEIASREGRQPPVE